RYRASGAKSDPADAYLLADVLRTDGHPLAGLPPDSEPTKILRALSRTRKDLVEARVALVNQLTSQPGRLLSRRHRAVPRAAPPTRRRVPAPLSHRPRRRPHPGQPRCPPAPPALQRPHVRRRAAPPPADRPSSRAPARPRRPDGR